MPLRSDPTVWYNLPGVVAAYQPIAAPGPLLARYNQAHGGDNRYRVNPGVLPTWTSASGWVGDGATTYFVTGLYPQSNWTIMVRFADIIADKVPIGSANTSFSVSYILAPRGSTGGTKVAYFNGSSTPKETAPNLSTGVLAIAGLYGYRNGVIDSAALPGFSGTSTYQLYVMAYNYNNTAQSFCDGAVATVAVWMRTLSTVEVWQASRQMAYCHVNPDWSAWGRKRRWYYAPSVAGFQAAWAAHSNAQIGTGVN